MQQEESLSTFEFWGCVGHIHKSRQALETLQNFQKEAGVDVLGYSVSPHLLEFHFFNGKPFT